MPVVAAIFAIAAAIWGVIVARRGSLLVGCGLLVMVSYVLGHEFWNVHIGPLPITLDRILLIALFATFALQWRLGDLPFRSMTGSDWLFAALLLLLTVSALCSGEPEFTNGVTSKWGRLFAAFLVPAAVYTFIRQLPITYCDWSRTLIALVVLGVYLALTGVFEVSHLWSLVFPRYISNPDLGIHFGRARGPDLNAVSLGIYLTAGCLCAWTLLPQALALAATRTADNRAADGLWRVANIHAIHLDWLCRKRVCCRCVPDSAALATSRGGWWNASRPSCSRSFMEPFG